MKKLYKTLVLVLVAMLFIQMPAAYAKTLDELKQEKKASEQKAGELQDSIKDKKSEIGQNENQQATILDKINDINAKIDATNKEIAALEKDISATNGEIEVLQESITALEKKIEERNVLLQERARSMQVTGSVSYIDVLLGSNSFVDFIDRFSAVTQILDADKKIIREQKADKNKLEDDKVVLENKKKKLEDDKAQQVKLKANLGQQKEEQRKLVAALEAEQEKLKSEKALLEEEYSEALNVSKEAEKQIAAEQARLAEIARKKAEAAAAAAKQNGSNSGPAVSSGTWNNPANGRLSSPFGWRNIGYGREFHYGIDIANGQGTAIVASNDGVVSYAGALSTYGNVVMITHYVNGGVWTTVYAHLSSINVSVGQEVDKAQKIGGMGNTGRSFGTHLHFEIHNGPWVSGRPYALNPLNYINR